MVKGYAGYFVSVRYVVDAVRADYTSSMRANSQPRNLHYDAMKLRVLYELSHARTCRIAMMVSMP